MAPAHPHATSVGVYSALLQVQPLQPVLAEYVDCGAVKLKDSIFKLRQHELRDTCSFSLAVKEMKLMETYEYS